MKPRAILSTCILLIILAGCAPGTATATLPAQNPTASPTLSPRDKMATAIAIDRATQSVKPTRIPSPTPDPSTLLSSGGWWNDTVFYEIFVRSFKDSNGDGVGDINGLIEKLDYLNDGDPDTTTDLGVTGIWLMPITESPSYHGYDVADYYSVDREYGTKEDFLRLIDAAHQRGIKVIVDLVINHTSDQNNWFKESNAGNPAYRDWYIWSESNPGYSGPWGQNVWHVGQNGYYYGLFWSGMPDLNLKNPAVTAEIDNITRFWLEDMHVDGFRMDAIRHLIENGEQQENTTQTHEWLKNFHRYYKSVDPQAFTVGEAWTQTPQIVEYVGDEMDIAFEFDLAQTFMSAAMGSQASGASKQMNVVLGNYPKDQYGVFLTNHDQTRVMSVLQDLKKAELAAVLLLTSPGVPFIYYGEEIGMTGTKPDENIRRPMQWIGSDSKVGFSTATPWNAASKDYPAINVATESNDPDSLLSVYRDLIRLRNDHAALRTGQTLVVESGSTRLYAILRYNDREAFLILVNVNSNALVTNQFKLTLAQGPFTGPVTATSTWGLIDPSAPEINAGGGFDAYAPFTEIPGQSAAIIQLTP
jgi:glycosidase